MSCCLGLNAEEREAIKASWAVERRMSLDNTNEKKKIKLLLLGAGESGKSTIFKQMRVLYGALLTEEEKQQITPVVYANTISSMKILVKQTVAFGYEQNVSCRFLDVPMLARFQSFLSWIYSLSHCEI